MDNQPMPDMFQICKDIGALSAKLDKIDSLEKTISRFIEQNDGKLRDLENKIEENKKMYLTKFDSLETKAAEEKGKNSILSVLASAGVSLTVSGILMFVAHYFQAVPK
jgi:hypothetical protein